MCPIPVMRFIRVTAVAVILVTVLLCLSMPTSYAQTVGEPYLKASDGDMEWWREARFGLFVHWGPVSLKGTEIGWSRGGERRGRGGTGSVPADEYDNLFRRFDPVRFNAREWVAAASDAGMKYIVFTSKHHDGFSMFDTKASEYRITSPDSPFGRDIVAELAEACHEAGMRFGLYYSPVDWYQPDYLTVHHDRYIDFMHRQVRELCSNYGRLDILWFDSLQIHPMSGSGGEEHYDPSWAKVWDAVKLFRTIRELQPRIIINNRCGLEGDFDTPEQHVGFYQTGRPWESCITICRQWAWKPDDTMKSLDECIKTLVLTAGGDGNLLLNVGPMPTGEIEPRQVERLREMGAWLSINGESIYGTRGGPVPPQSWGVTTHKSDRLYIHVLDDAATAVALPSFGTRIVSASLLDGSPVRFAETPLGTVIRLPDRGRDPHDTVIEAVCDRKIETD